MITVDHCARASVRLVHFDDAQLRPATAAVQLGQPTTETESPPTLRRRIALPNFYRDIVQHDWRRSVHELHERFVPKLLRTRSQRSSFSTPLVPQQQQQQQSPCDIPPHHRHTLLAGGTQTAEPQRVAATTTVLAPAAGTSSGAEDSSSGHSGPSASVRKYLGGSRSPSGQSPVTKSRKTPAGAASSAASTAPTAQCAGNVGTSAGPFAASSSASALLKDYSASATATADKDIGSPKSRTWKGLVARQFRRIQGAPSSPAASSLYGETLLPEGASIGVPLAHCPMVSGGLIDAICRRSLNGRLVSTVRGQ